MVAWLLVSATVMPAGCSCLNSSIDHGVDCKAKSFSNLVRDDLEIQPCGTPEGHPTAVSRAGAGGSASKMEGGDRWRLAARLELPVGCDVRRRHSRKTRRVWPMHLDFLDFPVPGLEWPDGYKTLSSFSISASHGVLLFYFSTTLAFFCNLNCSLLPSNQTLTTN